MRDHFPVHIFLILHFGKNTADKERDFLNILIRCEKQALFADFMRDIFSEDLIVRIKLFEDLENIKIHPLPAGLFAKSICGM